MWYGIISASQIQNSSVSFWQSTIWFQILTDSRQAKEVFYYGNIESSFFLVEIRSIGMWLYGAFVLGVSDSQIGLDWNSFLDNLQNFLKKKGIVFLQIEPINECKLAGIGKPYKNFLTPYTRIIPLTQTEEEILAQMHEKWRYNIKLAIKKGVEVKKVEANNANIDIWMGLLDETLERDSFAGNNRSYYEFFLKNIEKAGQGWLYFAQFEWQVIAAAIFVFTSERAIYYYGASSSDFWARKLFAPYLLQWEAIRYAKSQGIRQYDLLWVAESNNQKDPLAGVSFFKSRFWWRIIKLPPKLFISLSWKCSIFVLAQNIKNLLKRR